MPFSLAVPATVLGEFDRIRNQDPEDDFNELLIGKCSGLPFIGSFKGNRFLEGRFPEQGIYFSKRGLISKLPGLKFSRTPWLHPNKADYQSGSGQHGSIRGTR